MDSKILNGADRNKAAPFRETIALLFCLMSNEDVIKTHPKKCLLLTDCISLSQIFRSKDNNSKMMETALYLSSFSNLHVKYSTGSSLFYADLMTREYNKVHLDDKNQKLSDVWSQLHPPLDKKHIGVEISPEMLTDLLCGSPQSEYIDCFAKRKFYDQSLSRYHNNDDSVLRSSDPIPVELDFLSSIYGGWNTGTMSESQFVELDNLLKNFPAQQLAKKLSNSNLNALRKSLFDLNLHQDLLGVLGRKYFPNTWHAKQEMTISSFIKDVHLPDEIANVVHRALRKAGTPTDTKITKLSKGAGRSKLLQKTNNDIDHCQVSPQHDNDVAMTSQHGTENTRSLEMGGEHVSSQYRAQRTVDVHYNLTSYTKSDVDDDNKLLSRHLDVLQRENLTELEILEAFGINEKELRKVLTPISRNLLEIFYYFKHGQTLSKNDDFSLLDSMLNTENVEKLWNGDQLSLEALLRMLLLITDYFQNRKFFFDKNVIRIPYLFNDKEFLILILIILKTHLKSSINFPFT